jgi:hypothetical protein
LLFLPSIYVDYGNNLDLDDLFEFLHELNIMSSIKNNNSVICDNNSCWLEYGCDITLTDFNPKLIKEKIWQTIG